MSPASSFLPTLHSNTKCYRDMASFFSLPNEVLSMISMDMDVTTVRNFCATHSRFNSAASCVRSVGVAFRFPRELVPCPQGWWTLETGVECQCGVHGYLHYERAIHKCLDSTSQLPCCHTGTDWDADREVTETLKRLSHICVLLPRLQELGVCIWGSYWEEMCMWGPGPVVDGKRRIEQLQCIKLQDTCERQGIRCTIITS